MPRISHRTRVCHLLAAGSQAILRHDGATLVEMAVYAAQTCTWVDPITQTMGVRFDLGVPPGQSVPMDMVRRFRGQA